jgi:hypothetical protein
MPACLLLSPTVMQQRCTNTVPQNRCSTLLGQATEQHCDLSAVPVKLAARPAAVSTPAAAPASAATAATAASCCSLPVAVEPWVASHPVAAIRVRPGKPAGWDRRGVVNTYLHTVLLLLLL